MSMSKEVDRTTENSVSGSTDKDKTFSSSFKTKRSLDGQDDTIDPRVQVELEKLNTATDLINKLEIELDEARANFRLLLTESSQRINQQAVKLGNCIHKARPYYEARMISKELQQETQKAALRFERASSAHTAAKEMVRLSEEGLCAEGRTFDPAWQEMLNHSTMKVNEAEQERRISKALHMKTSQSYNTAEQNVQRLHVQFKKAIAKSSLSARRSLLQLNNLSNQHQLQLLPYFEMKAQFNQLLEEQKRKVHNIEENVMQVKMGYSETLHSLERISDEIHMRRKKKGEMEFLGQRTEGVGAEDPPQHINGTPRHQHFSPETPPPATYEGALEKMPDVLPENNTPEPSATASWKSETEVVAKPTNELSQKGGTLKESAYSSPDFEESIKPQETRELQSKCNGSQEDKMPTSAVLPGGLGMLLPNPTRGDEMSDTESLGSTDTADTLDDHQIECLLLDRVLELDYHDLLTTATTTDVVSSSP